MSAPILIDGDGVLLTACQAASELIEWETFQESLYVDLNLAKDNVHAMVEKYKEHLGYKRPVTIALSCPTRRYFRHEIYPAYKSARVGGPVPKVGLKSIRDWAKLTFHCEEWDNLEADDVLGILATKHMQEHDEMPTIVSVDKDMKQIPCSHLSPMYLDDEPLLVTPEEGQRYWWEQVLTGDTVDGYPGCKGVGPVRAKRILAEAENYPEAVQAAYLKAGHSEEYFIQMVNVARILTVYSWDALKQKPILWTPYDGAM